MERLWFELHLHKCYMMFNDLKSEGNVFYYLAGDVSFQISFLAKCITSLIAHKNHLCLYKHGVILMSKPLQANFKT